MKCLTGRSGREAINILDFVKDRKTKEIQTNKEVMAQLLILVSAGNDLGLEQSAMLQHRNISIAAPPNATGKHRPFHLDRMIVRRIFQILNEQFDRVENDDVSHKRGSSRKDLANLTAFISESLKNLEQAINNGAFATSIKDPAGEKQRSGISTSKITHQLDYSMSWINEVIPRQMRLNSRLGYSKPI
uniref:Uncharacterized protein n=1 Tax=Romanomermis culicivorax TaxID=13658 RepID=A0A915JV41_ROMCU